ncbi:hypothetical protein PAECIP111891_00410 [Paenibacillus allorhizoplanae]|uniref:Uncharacterized protein n=1 Tax=Paenibacillus allorhizoplanae TaxID=2905648 RepID=A0ABN8G040_9BACL|nr:hypothetical protein PAECIP111891_00410 [Paenibacillus allorhizoplanae]
MLCQHFQATILQKIYKVGGFVSQDFAKFRYLTRYNF